MDKRQERKTEDRPERSLRGKEGEREGEWPKELFLKSGEKCIKMLGWFHQVIQVAVAMSWKL